jgi:DNA-binding IclR family transcriptional regulator
VQTANTVKRAFDILNFFLDNKSELGVSDIALELGMNKSTVHRLITTLVDTKIVSKTRGRPKYRLGGKILDFAEAYLSNIDIKTVCYNYLKELHTKTGESISIHIRVGDQTVCLDRIDSKYEVKRVFRVGEHHPIQAGSAGKCFLAYLSDNEIDQIIKRTGLPRYTDQTITSKKELKKEIAKIRKEGFAMSFAEKVNLCAMVSAPIRRYGGEVIAVINILWVTDSPDPKTIDNYSNLVKEAAKNASREMGYFKL